MKAAVIRAFGGPEVLTYDDLPDPTAGPGEVVVRVEAVTVNQALDVKVRSGARAAGVALPHVLGLDPSGVVESVGDGVDPARIGERVAVASAMWCGRCEGCLAGRLEDCASAAHIGVKRHGGYAELVAVPSGNAHVIPDSLDFADASVLMRHLPVAHNLLVVKGGLQPGETVLVMGASGGLGSTGVQLAKQLGATVIAGAGADDRVAAARALGADHGVNYRASALSDAVADVTDGRGVDVVFENVGDPTLWPQVIASMAHSGRLVTAGAHGGGHVELDVHSLYRKRLRLVGGGGHNPDDVARALELAAGGALRGLVDTEFPLVRAADAHRLAESGNVAGKIVLRPTRKEPS